MRRYSILFLLSLITLSGCDKSFDYQEPDCTNTVITFRHFNTPDKDELLTCVQANTHLLFKDDIMVGMMNVNGSQMSTGLLHVDIPGVTQSIRQIKLNLPPGNYSLKSWGNYSDGVSAFTDHTLGTTPKNDFALNHIATMPNKNLLSGQSNPLYYGKVSFTVAENGQVNKIVDMINAHAQFHITVRWKNMQQYPNTNYPIYMNMEDVPIEYLMETKHSIDLTLSGDAGKALLNVPKQSGNKGEVAVQTSVIAPHEVKGVMQTFRMQSDTHPILSLYGGADGTSRYMKKIDLHRFFQEQGVDLENNLKQYFKIEIEIDGDTINVFFVNINDWEEGW